MKAPRQGIGPAGLDKNMSRTWTLLLYFLAALLCLHLYLSRSAHPMADDFSYALKDVSQGAWQAAAWQYTHWNGRYASNFLVLFGPLRLGLTDLTPYRCVPVLMLLLTLLACGTLLRACLSRALSTSTTWTAALIWTVLQLHLLPDIGEGAYWYTGIVTYQLADILVLFAAALIVHARRTGQGRSAWGAVPLLAFATGCNEVIMLLLVAAALLAIGLHRWKRLHLAPAERLAIAVVFVGAAVMCAAPGNAGRSANFPTHHQFGHSLVMGLAQTARFSLDWILCPSMLLFSVLWLVMRRSLGEQVPALANGFGLRPGASLALLFAPVFLSVFPAYWSTGILGQHRTPNVACLYFLPLWFVNLSVLASRVPRPPALSANAHRWLLRLVPLLILLDLAATGNSGRAIGDQLTGRARRSNEQLWQRYRSLEEQARAGRSIAEIPVITDPPRSLYLLEIRDAAYLSNRDYAAWFGLREVRRADPLHKEPLNDTSRSANLRHDSSSRNSAMRARYRGAAPPAKKRMTACAMAGASAVGTSRPVRSSSTLSFNPPTSVAITGVPK